MCCHPGHRTCRFLVTFNDTCEAKMLSFVWHPIQPSCRIKSFLEICFFPPERNVLGVALSICPSAHTFNLRYGQMSETSTNCRSLSRGHALRDSLCLPSSKWIFIGSMLSFTNNDKLNHVNMSTFKGRRGREHSLRDPETGNGRVKDMR